jgi:hypothetical protein
VIGNPPWDRIKLQEVEWFAAREPRIALLARASDRQREIQGLCRQGTELAREFERAEWVAETAARVARATGHYPLLSGGDANLYALFVERSLRLIKPTGLLGLLVPSGIAADKGAARFFGGVATTGRLAGLFDFENRRTRHDQEPFFPDVDSRFKFSALIVTGQDRQVSQSVCAFFKQSAAEAEAEAFSLAPSDFAAVNPNTGTAPVFRTRRDADLTVGIYRRLPVLVNRSVQPPAAVWPVRYLRMFDMTNDSGLFKTEAELLKLGARRAGCHRWAKDKKHWVPLYEGKMAQAFDHRAASVVINPQNVHRPGQPQPATPAEYADPSWLPSPHFWVSSEDLPEASGKAWVLGYKDITSPTNARTFIAAIFPSVEFGNKVPLLLPNGTASQADYFKMGAIAAS